MAKISKRLLKKHNQAVSLLEQKNLAFDDIQNIFKDYHEGAGKMNNLISAHFTPTSIAISLVQNVRMNNFVDIGAGIGMLANTMVNQNFFQNKKGFTGICVEKCLEYYEVGKRLVPECIWLHGSIFDQDILDTINQIMDGKKFSIISNPPYGSKSKGSNPEMNYTGASFEYKAMEIGAMLGAYDGAFLIPQNSAPFRITGVNPKGVYSEDYKTENYKKFVEQTNLEITPNNGFTTKINEGEEDGWKDVSVVTEIAIVEYDELEYKSKQNLLAHGDHN
jgi:predicted RNA methylase